MEMVDAVPTMQWQEKEEENAKIVAAYVALLAHALSSDHLT
jgi:hypothetical protein